MDVLWTKGKQKNRASEFILNKKISEHNDGSPELVCSFDLGSLGGVCSRSHLATCTRRTRDILRNPGRNIVHS